MEKGDVGQVRNWEGIRILGFEDPMVASAWPMTTGVTAEASGRVQPRVVRQMESIKHSSEGRPGAQRARLMRGGASLALVACRAPCSVRSTGG